jgi:ring-1,2-phenylacetyl-CoA epoxidase subunit PaaC
VLGQRNAEWCGHGPILEEDIAQSNVSLDLIGQARLLYQLVATLKGGDVTEDKLAYFRDTHEFRNYTLLELPHHGPLSGYASSRLDYGTTIVRNFLYSALMALLWEALEKSANADLAAIAAKSLKEVRYHLRHSATGWCALATAPTNRMPAPGLADHLFPYTQEFWTHSPAEAAAVAAGIGVDVRAAPDWDAIVDAALAEATLTAPGGWRLRDRRQEGRPLRASGFLLAEMQSLARAHPNGVW